MYNRIIDFTRKNLEYIWWQTRFLVGFTATLASHLDATSQTPFYWPFNISGLNSVSNCVFTLWNGRRTLCLRWWCQFSGRKNEYRKEKHGVSRLVGNADNRHLKKYVCHMWRQLSIPVQQKCQDCYSLFYFLGLYFDPEDESITFLWNACKILPRL